MAFALVLLVGSGLMVRSFWHLTQIDPGFEASNLLSFDLGVGSAYSNPGEVVAFYDELSDRLRGLPGVEAVAHASCPPLRRLCVGTEGLHDQAQPNSELAPEIEARVVRVTPGYFDVLEISVLDGRRFERGLDDSLSVVVSRSLAEARWPGLDPVGRRVSIGVYSDTPPGRWMTVVGVVGDVVEEELIVPYKYLTQILYHIRTGRTGAPTRSVLMRTTTPPLGLVDAVRNTVWEMDADVPISNVQSMEETERAGRASMAFMMVLVVVGGVAALLLGVVGIYGVIAYVVGRRTGEIGIRMALGARAADVQQMVLGQGATVVSVGILIGLAGALALTRVMSAMVFGVSPTDPATYAVASTGLLVIAMVAMYVPARRAAAVEPVEALRAD